MKLTKTTFYLLSCTWGIIHTALGALVALSLLISGHKPKKHGYCTRFELDRMVGGCSMGPFFITSPRPSERICDHEHGHAIQNCIWGPLFPFVIGAPSFLRCQYRRIRKRLNPKLRQKPYDSIWFEGQATELGRKLRAAIK